MLESKRTKSCIGIKHPRRESVLLHCDAKKLLELSRGFRSQPVADAAGETAMRREYVEEADLIHEDVFDELRRVFPDVLQFQRLLLVDGVKEWDGWAHVKSLLLVSSQTQNMKRVYLEEFVHAFIQRCQINCVGGHRTCGMQIVYHVLKI